MKPHKHHAISPDNCRKPRNEAEFPLQSLIFEQFLIAFIFQKQLDKKQSEDKTADKSDYTDDIDHRNDILFVISC